MRLGSAVRCPPLSGSGKDACWILLSFLMYLTMALADVLRQFSVSLSYHFDILRRCLVLMSSLSCFVPSSHKRVACSWVISPSGPMGLSGESNSDAILSFRFRRQIAIWVESDTTLHTSLIYERALAIPFARASAV